jgi:hypothetical protein
MEKINPDPESGMNISDPFSESLETVLGLKLNKTNYLTVVVQVLTLGGSLRRRIGSLEVMNGDGNSSGSSGRAKENTYSFV